MLGHTQWAVIGQDLWKFEKNSWVLRLGLNFLFWHNDAKMGWNLVQASNIFKASAQHCYAALSIIFLLWYWLWGFIQSHIYWTCWFYLLQTRDYWNHMLAKCSINAFNISCSECCLVYSYHNLSPCCDFASVHHCAPMICDDPIGAIEPVIGCISLGMLYRS